MKKIIVLNHKMNLYYNELENYLNRVNQLNHNLIIAPSNIYLLEFIKRSQHKTASQDICYIEEGNHTSKVSWHQLKSIGINSSIIGHSEKNEELIKTNLKLITCLENQMTPILCFDLDNNSLTNLEILTNNISSIKNIIFAYEPSENINNQNIDLNKINSNIELIYHYLKDKYQEEPTILYGGGINEDNIKNIYEEPKLSGILLGSSSADINTLEKILSKI